MLRGVGGRCLEEAGRGAWIEIGILIDCWALIHGCEMVAVLQDLIKEVHLVAAATASIRPVDLLPEMINEVAVVRGLFEDECGGDLSFFGEVV